MRNASAIDLTHRIGIGHWSGRSRIQSIRERIALGDPKTLRHGTLYVAIGGAEVVGSVVVSTFPPAFWKRNLWNEPRAAGLGVFALVVLPQFQRLGIGRFLMEGVELLAQEREIRYVRLDAYALNPISTAFYRRIGYEDRGEIDLRGVRLVLFEKHIS